MDKKKPKPSIRDTLKKANSMDATELEDHLAQGLEDMYNGFCSVANGVIYDGLMKVIKALDEADLDDDTKGNLLFESLSNLRLYYAVSDGMPGIGISFKDINKPDFHKERNIDKN
jgi:hypothetical protein